MRKSDFIFRYRVRNWPAYNKALVRRGSLTFWVDEEAVGAWRDAAAAEPLGGRPRVYSDIAKSIPRLYSPALSSTAVTSRGESR
jgi:hypothetical protein